MENIQEKRQFIIITGLSGAGKTQAAHFLEDMGFYCVDNLPPTLILKFAELYNQAGSQLSRVALVVDIRGGEFFDHPLPPWGNGGSGIAYRIIFLDASDETWCGGLRKPAAATPWLPPAW